MKKIVKTYENDQVYIEARRKLMINAFWLSSLLIVIIECLFYFIFKHFDKIEGSDFEYIKSYIIIPSSICFGLAGISTLIERISKKEGKKNLMLIINISLVVLTISYVHNDFVLLRTIFVFPVFITVMFGNRIYTLLTTGLNTFLFTISVYNSYRIDKRFTDNDMMESIIILSIIVCSYIITSILIDFEAESLYLLRSNQDRQDVIVEQAKRDPLTGLYNKKIFYDNLSICMKQCDRICVAVIDIDNFKVVNDTYGHSVGDIVLTTLSENLIKISKEDNRISPARYGGEEFAIIFKDMNIRESFKKIEDFRNEFSAIKFSEMENKSVQFSCGITGDVPQVFSNVKFFDEADQALYYAKGHGKNQTIVYSDIKDLLETNE